MFHPMYSMYFQTAKDFCSSQVLLEMGTGVNQSTVYPLPARYKPELFPPDLLPGTMLLLKMYAVNFTLTVQIKEYI